MSKFLNLVEENTPEHDLDNLTAGKRALQRCLLQHDISAHATQHDNNIVITLNNGSVVTLEVKKYNNVTDEDEDAVLNAGEMLASSDPAKRKPVSRELDKYKMGVRRIEPKVTQKLADRNAQINSIQKDFA